MNLKIKPYDDLSENEKIKYLEIGKRIVEMKLTEVQYYRGELARIEEELFIFIKRLLIVDEEIEHYSKTKIQTFIRNAKKLATLSNGEVVSVRKTNEGKIVYQIEKPNKYILIEEKILRVLISFCSTNAIKTYVFLKWKCRENGCIISRKEICENIGLSSTGERQLQEITDITKGLQKLGLINRKTTTDISVDGKDYNRSTYYELVPFERWEKYWESEENPNKR